MGDLGQRAIGLTPFQASGDIRDVAEICMKSNKNTHKSEFGPLPRITMTGLRIRIKRERKRQHGTVRRRCTGAVLAATRRVSSDRAQLLLTKKPRLLPLSKATRDQSRLTSMPCDCACCCAHCTSLSSDSQGFIWTKTQTALTIVGTSLF